ncbi:MAG: TIGR04141 family sporadically distributed protein [Lysobacter sp.]|nr:TIGR04141 family sporadically distributed protein [Lysobacter sp.]
MPSLTIYLLRGAVKKPVDALAQHADHHVIADGDKHVGDLYVAPKPEKSPSWAPLFAGYVDLNKLGKIRSTGALLVVKVKGRLFAISFGQGRFILSQEAIEERFGLLVTLNSLEADALRSVDKRTFDAVDQNSRVQVGQTSAAPEFGIDIERDLIKGIVGYPPLSAGLGRRLAGSDALTVSMDIELSGLKPLLRRYLKAFESKAYLEHFSWIDQIHQVRKKGDLANTLNSLLIEKLEHARANGGLVSGCWMAVPDVLNWSAVAGFRFSQRVKDGMMADMHLPGFMNSLKGDDILSIELLKMRHAYAVNDDHHELEHWSVYKCLHCELDHDGRSYLLSGGQWFEVNKDFVESIDQFYDSIPGYPEPLLVYNHHDEASYNKALVASNPSRWALMDAKPIAVGGIYDKVEFCDVYGVDRELLHIKRYGGSNVLGHLFNQGLVSGELLREHKGYAELVNKYLPGSHALSKDEDTPRDVSKFRIVFGIVSQSDEAKVHVPFFARVALKNVYKRLESIGFTSIALAKISCEPGLKKLVKLKAKK